MPVSRSGNVALSGRDVPRKKPEKTAQTPPLSNRGGLAYKSQENRPLPKVEKLPVPEGYAKVLAWGFDTIEETFDITVAPAFVGALEQAKAMAAESDDIVALEWGGEIFHVAGHGGQGATKFIFQNDDFLFRMRAPEKPWPLSVRYLSAGLWELGHEAMRARVRNFLTTIIPEEWKSRARGGVNHGVGSLKRLDFAVDIWSPEFTAEFDYAMFARKPVVMHSEVKQKIEGTSERVETLTLGIKGSLQVQVYDKGKEISDMSGKTWMFDLWRRAGWPGPDENGRARDVWRVECRFFKDWVQKRGINHLDVGIERRSALMAEALYSRRLTRPNPNDSNRRRWPLHPVWSLAADVVAGDFMLPLGKIYTERRDTLAEMMVAQMAGCARSHGVLTRDDFKEADIPLTAGMFARRLTRVAGDRKKIEALKERYRFIDEAR